MRELLKMEVGKIYHISFGSAELIARYKSSDTCNHFTFSGLYYWSGFENYKPNGHCVKAGIEAIRPATNCEKFNLFRFEVEKGDV